MMEPISVAVAAFGAIKAGVSAGKELHSLGKQVGQLFDAIDELHTEIEVSAEEIAKQALQHIHTDFDPGKICHSGTIFQKSSFRRHRRT